SGRLTSSCGAPTDLPSFPTRRSSDLPKSSVVTLLGRNGAGKSTTLKTLAGAVTPRQGSIKFNGQEIAGLPAYRVAGMGICLVPENRKSTRLNSSHVKISYAVFCLKKK